VGEEGKGSMKTRVGKREEKGEEGRSEGEWIWGRARLKKFTDRQSF